ncbi:hypothetical protein E0H73_32300 [Kribbella pittospori]|uniref:Uncharacterized protein n=1 Tax=Kribbella pittospori TaxID=722689 RepID=A0A4R0KKX2_9ACTN|nr:hypothetical protein [Kribbella pittospori]TCC56375.1 hypothetical protein E0H73_32300 [Kribbella pittospori]
MSRKDRFSTTPDVTETSQAFPGGWYRNQFWFRPSAQGNVLLCLGIHAKMLYVCRRTRTVCVKLSNWPDPQRPAHLQDTLRAFDALTPLPRSSIT